MTCMTHVDFTDAYAKVPLSDDGIGAWQPLTDEQRWGIACLDCGRVEYHDDGRRQIGTTDEGPVRVCLACYIQRLRDHIDYFRPQS